MQALFERVPTPGQQRSWTFKSGRQLRAGEFDWHYHPEYELTLTTSGAGTRFVGDSICEFGPGDLVLVGPSLPHTWQAHAGTQVTAVVMQFRRAFLGADLFDRPEFGGVRRMLARAAHGLAFGQADSACSRDEIQRMGHLNLPSQTTTLLSLLVNLSEVRDSWQLASEGFAPELGESARRRIELVCSYITKHYSEELQFTEIASLAAMTPAAFSRFFRRSTGKTFTSYLTEIRVGAARRLLIETDLPVTVVASRSGFHNISNFNRRFRELTELRPREFRNMYRPQG